MKTLFENISKEENSELSVTYGASYSKLITFSPFLDDKHTGEKVTSLSLVINYRNQKIILLNETNSILQGKLHCVFEKDLELPDFNISSRNHFSRLINKRLNALEVECAQEEFENFIEMQLLKLELETIARNNQFEPIIKGTNKDAYEISTTYSLSFSKKKEVVQPLLVFYKLLIDHSLDGDWM